MLLKSRIKKIFPEELLKLIASVCDTTRIRSVQHKMLVIQQLLKKYDIRFGVSGGATNRFVLLIDRYAVKFALDNQGYVDNLIEYSICRELQPYVSKSYETNGYILIAECVKTFTSIEEFKLRRTDIESVLSVLAQDYLLGDVGFIEKNYTNWGMRDDGSVVILDYAYIHRGTEKLFSCEVCGCGILRYDPTYSYLKCSNTASCNAQYTYIERKAIQGDQVDLDMIEEAKSESICLPKGKLEREVSDNNGKLVTGNKIITNSFTEYLKYLTEVNHMSLHFDEEKVMELLVKKATCKTEEEKAAIDEQIKELYHESDSEDETPEVVYEPSYGDTINYDAELEEAMEKQVGSPFDTDVFYAPEAADGDHGADINDLVDIAMGKKSLDCVKTVPDTDSEEKTELSDGEYGTSITELIDIATKAVYNPTPEVPTATEEALVVDDPEKDNINSNTAEGVYLNGERIK